MNGLQYPVRTITAAGAITVLTSDVVIAIAKTTGAASAVALPLNMREGTLYIIKDEKGDAGTNNITITPNTGDTIEGTTTYVISTNRAWVGICYNFTTKNWMRIQ